MTPKNKIKREILLQAQADEPDLMDYGPLDSDEAVDDAYDRFDGVGDTCDYESQFREGQVETDIPAEYSRHYESRSVARKMVDGTWVGWTYWYGGASTASLKLCDGWKMPTTSPAPKKRNWLWCEPSRRWKMSQKKKQVRADFRNACFKRDKYCCAMCSFKSTPAKAEDELDAHHITDRNEMPNGGYVKENGISLCAKCHELAEVFHSTGEAHPGYAPEDLYNKIGSSHERAYAASERLG